MTFDSAPYGTYFLPFSYVEDGIKMSLVSGHCDLYGGFVQVDTQMSTPDGGPSIIKFEMVSGSLFNLNLVDLWIREISMVKYTNSWPSFSFSNGVTFTLSENNVAWEFSGYQNDNGSATINFDDWGIATKNLAWFTYNSRFYSGFDNVNMTAVPGRKIHPITHPPIDHLRRAG
jgi:hypothetical protein